MATGTGAVNTEENDNRRTESREALRPRLVGAESSPGNVDKIRDILFGTQMRDYEARFARLEETLLKEATDLKDSTRKRFDALESYLRRELESLESRLKTEREERAETLRQLSGDVRSLSDSLSRKIAEVLDHSVHAERQ